MLCHLDTDLGQGVKLLSLSFSPVEGMMVTAVSGSYVVVGKRVRLYVAVFEYHC